MRNVFDDSRRPVQVAVAFAATGFVLIVLGWNGAANLDYTQGQIPYLISGGVAGLALVLVGLTLLVVHEIKRATARLLAAMERAAETGAVATRPTLVPDEGPAVVAGRSTYHLPTCRVVAERPDLQTMRPTAAIERGLAPCRICDARTAAS